MWPDTPPAAATVFALIGINVGIFALWKFPPAWRMLNRYFISAPLYPYALSMIGTVFSHQMAKHTLVNTGILFFLGTKSKYLTPVQNKLLRRDANFAVLSP